MAAFKINRFSGLYPRLPDSLLPEGAATVASNCDFAYGELRNTKGGYLLNTMRNAPVSIYTDDGLTFYTWPTDVDAVRSPLVNDTFTRLYFTDGATMKVTNRTGTSLNGGPPASSYNVGVPRPSVAPVLAVAIPDVTDASKYTMVWKFHYEYGGVKYQEATLNPSVISNNINFSFMTPTMQRQVSHATRDEFPETGEAFVTYKASDTGKLFYWSGSAYVETSVEGTPAQAFPVIRLTATTKADGSQLFDIYTDNSSLTSTGGLWSLSVAKTETTNYLRATLTTAIKEADKEARAYVYVYRNTYDESGPPSAPAIVNTSPVVNVSVTVTKDAASGYAPIKAIDVYRTPTGSTIAEYFYVGTLDVLSGSGTFTFTDNVKAGQLNEALSSTNHYPPPSGLVGLMTLPNGILCAWKGNELWFSEAYKPWAWPPQYVKPLPATIVGGIAHGSGAIVTTVKNPYVVSGVSPDSMTASRLNVDQAGVSKWSIAVVDGVCMYASNDGLVAVTGGSANLTAGQRFFTREVWRARYGSGLSGMRFSVWDGRLVAFSGSNAFTPFMLRVDEADGTMTDLPNLVASCAFVSQLSDQFYYALGIGIYQFNGGTGETATWQSRESVMPRTVNFGMAQAVVDGNWTVEFWAYTGGSFQLKHTQAVASGVTNFRLPSGYESDRYKVKLIGSGKFRELRVAQTARELATL